MKFPTVVPRHARVSTYAIVGSVGLAVLMVGLAIPFIVADPDSTAVSNGATPPGEITADAAPNTSGTEPIAPGSAAVGESPTGSAAANNTRVGSSASGNTSATGPLPASDRGVTSTEIRVGFLQPDFGGAARLGVGTGDADPEADAQAFRLWAEEINATGGVLGRKLRINVAEFDRVTGGAPAARAACLQLVKDAQSFIVLEAGAASTQPAHACITQEHETLMLARHSSMTAEDLNAAGGRLVTLHMSVDRQWDAIARLSHQDGLLKGRKIGVVTSEFPVENAAANRGLIPRLKALGYEVTHKTTLSGDIGTAQSQMSVEVTQMRTKGVDLVFLATNLFYAQLWAQQSDAQRHTPLYGVADMGATANDTALQNMPASFSAFAYSANAAQANKNVGQARPQAAIEPECLRRYESFTKQRLSPDSHDVERIRQVNACVFLSFFREVAAGVGPQLTTRAMVSRLATSGGLSRWWAEPTALGFASGKFDAADTLRKVVTARPCPKDPEDRTGCWVPAGDFRRP